MRGGRPVEGLGQRDPVGIGPGRARDRRSIEQLVRWPGLAPARERMACGDTQQPGSQRGRIARRRDALPSGQMVSITTSSASAWLRRMWR
jgi:hypothetical protein